MLKKLCAALRWRLVRSATFGGIVREAVLRNPVVYGGPRDRVQLGTDIIVNDVLFNVSSGRIVVGDASFFGHGVSLLTGTHDIRQRGLDRQRSAPREGRDIVVGRGVWVASNVTILGPCVIGDDAVIATGAVVTKDVEPGAIVAGVPARVIGSIDLLGEQRQRERVSGDR